MRTSVTLLATAFLLLASATRLTAQPPGGKGPVDLPPEAVGAAEGAGAFGLDLYRNLAARDGNLFLSPLSVSAVLSMAYAGAGGKTAEAFERTLIRLPGGSAEPLGAWKTLEDSLSAAAEGSELSIAGSLWPEKSAALKRGYLRSVERAFGARIFPQDFAKGGDAPRQAINSWASRETKGKVKELLGGPLPPDTRLVLANAVYFKGGWRDTFDPEATAGGTFHAAGGGKIKARFMKRTGPYGYLEDSLGQVLELPYSGRRLAMLVLLPGNAKDGMERLAGSLDWPALSKRLEGLATEQVEASLPRFSVSWGTESLREALDALGLGPAFAPDADFSRMSGEPLKISDVLHQAFVDVTEEGTEAAAASAAVVVRSAHLPSGKPRIFKADRPFVFLIRERETGAILFIGRLSEPAGES
ncbi:MAG: serpin family protein [Deltaproteobacteria bacterium]|jgi:serpin B|nr:serpin family protein [Deltaproteobacteria bacterium]